MGSHNGGPENRIKLDWLEYEALAVELADKLRPYRPNLNRVTIPQLGGAFVGLVVGRRLGFTADQVLSASLTSYPPGSTQAGKLKTGQLPRREEIEGLDHVILDDCCDGGTTMKSLRDHYLANKARSVLTAVIFHKPGSCRPDFAPDIYVETTDAWIEFPDEPHEQVGKQLVTQLSEVGSTASLV